MNTDKQSGPWFSFESSRFYGPTELYSNGSDIQFSTQDLEQATAAFNSRKVHERGETYMVRVTECATGAVLMHKGPSHQSTVRSMFAALRRRYAKFCAA